MRSAVETQASYIVVNERLPSAASQILMRAAALGRAGVMTSTYLPDGDTTDIADLIERLRIELAPHGFMERASAELLARTRLIAVLTERREPPYADGGPETWRVKHILSITGVDDGGEPTWVDLWRTAKAGARMLQPTGEVFRRSVVPASDIPLEPERDTAASETTPAPARYIVDHADLDTTGLLTSWLQPDQPFLSEIKDCQTCRTLELELTAAQQDTAGAVRFRRDWHYSLHELVLRVLDDHHLPASALESLRLPTAELRDGRPVLSDPRVSASDMSLAFYVLHRHHFGHFVRATMLEADAGPTLTLEDDRGQMLELNNLNAGYSGTTPHKTLWILRVAGFRDYPDRIQDGHPRYALETVVFEEREFSIDPEWTLRS